MPLQCGIVGLTNTGKTTLFNCISNTKAQTGGFAAQKANLGIISVPDDRLYILEKFQKTERIVHTTVEIVDIPGLTKGGSKNEGGNRFLAEIRNTDAIIHVLRCFDSDTVPHIEGSVDPVRDLENVDFEMQVKDLETIEKKLQRLEKNAKIGGDREAKRTIEVLHVYKQHVESLQNARTAPVSEDDKKYIADMFLLTAKPVMYVCNVDAKSAVLGNLYVEQVKKALAGQDAELLIIAAATEAEIAELDNPEDRTVFLEDVGLSEPGVNKLVRAAYHLLNLRTFFTIGPDEIRAWTIKAGINVQMASGVIHSDLERGFIRAEVMHYQDFISLGSEKLCKEHGKLFVEGKNYIVQDGDILHIRFNV